MAVGPAHQRVAVLDLFFGISGWRFSSFLPVVNRRSTSHRRRGCCRALSHRHESSGLGGRAHRVEQAREWYGRHGRAGPGVRRSGSGGQWTARSRANGSTAQALPAVGVSAGYNASSSSGWSCWENDAGARTGSGIGWPVRWCSTRRFTVGQDTWNRDATSSHTTLTGSYWRMFRIQSWSRGGIVCAVAVCSGIEKSK